MKGQRKLPDPYTHHLTPREQHLVVADRERRWAGLARAEENYITSKAEQARRHGNTIVAAQFDHEAAWDRDFERRRLSIAERHERAARTRR
jgi:hypothetical protein